MNLSTTILFYLTLFCLVQKCCSWGCGCRRACVNPVIIKPPGKWSYFYHKFCLNYNVYRCDKFPSIVHNRAPILQFYYLLSQTYWPPNSYQMFLQILECIPYTFIIIVVGKLILNFASYGSSIRLHGTLLIFNFYWCQLR